MHITRKPIKLSDGDRGGLPVTASCSERGCELWPAVESVSALPRLDLGELRDDLEPLGLSEASDGCALGVDTEARLSLLASADPIIGDERLHFGCSVLTAAIGKLRPLLSLNIEMGL
jgi:hypothetical protein